VRISVWAWIAGFSCAISATAWADEEQAARADTVGSAAEKRPEDRPPRRMRLFPPRFYAFGMFYLPEVSYSVDRGLGAGAAAYFPFRWAGADVTVPASTFHGRLHGTTKGQVASELETALYLGSLPWTLRLKVTYTDFAERFYGIGPDAPASAEEVYRPERFRAYVELHRPLVERVSLGARLEVEHVLLTDREASGALVRNEIRGTEPSTVTGVGLLLHRDTRDDDVFPRHGTYLEASAFPFIEALGALFDFDNHFVDARAVFPVRGEHAFATQLFYYAARGEAPFWRYASLGGREHTRGIRRDRYLDRVLVAFQGELRAAFVGRFGFVAFAGLADVAPHLGELELEHMKPSIGGGVRVRLGSGRGPLARLDIGGGEEGVQIDLDFGQAF